MDHHAFLHVSLDRYIQLLSILSPIWLSTAVLEHENNTDANLRFKHYFTITAIIIYLQ